MRETSIWIFKNLTPLYRYTYFYNDRYEEKIKIIQNRLNSLGIFKIGKRNDTCCKLNYSRLNSGFWLYWLKKFIFFYIKQNSYVIKIDFDIIEQRIKLKQQIQIHLKKNNSNPTKIKITEYDLFIILFDKYEKQINGYETPMLGVVPVVNYIPLTGHRKLYGDGCRPPCMIICRMPIEYYCKRIQSKMFQMDRYKNDQIKKCRSNPYSGNKHTHNVHLCELCALFVIYTSGIHASEINKFIEYYELIQYKNKIYSKMIKINASNKLHKLHESFKNTENFINKHFNNVKSKFEKYHKSITDENQINNIILRQSDRNLQQIIQEIRNNLNEFDKPEDYDDDSDDCDENYEQNQNNEDETIYRKKCMFKISDIINYYICFCFFFLCKVNEVLNLEQFDDEFIAENEGCRSVENHKANGVRMSGGLMSVMMLDGYYVNISPIIYRETSIGIIKCINELLLGSLFITYIQYCEGFGWDMICRIFLSLITMFSEGTLETRLVLIWCALMYYFFGDRFHIQTHVMDICSAINGQGIFNPKLIRWKQLLQNNNDNVVEQSWRNLNRLYSLKRLSYRKFYLAVKLYSEFHNDQLLQKHIRKYGDTIWFEPVNNFKKLRFDSESLSQISINKVEKMKTMSYNELKKLMIDSIINYTKTSDTTFKSLEESDRIKYCNQIEIKYINIFNRNKDFNHNPISKYHTNIIEMDNNNNSLNTILNFVHLNLCSNSCLCYHHRKYLIEFLSQNNEMDLD